MMKINNITTYEKFLISVIDEMECQLSYVAQDGNEEGVNQQKKYEKFLEKRKIYTYISNGKF